MERILENREGGTDLKRQAVLFRTSHHSGPLELELVRRNIPFVKFGGLKFLDAAHVKDFLALLRFVENPRDRVAGFRLLQFLPGVGAAAAQAVLDRIGNAPDPARALIEGPSPPKGGADWQAFIETFTALSEGKPGGLPSLRSHGAGTSRIWNAFTRTRRHAEPILLQLEQIAGGYPSRERFLTELTLDPPEATSGEAGVPHLDEDYLILSTIHSAKGQEWRAVFVLNAVDGCIPSDMGTGTTEEIEEERRLLYVAMTRARDSLHLVVPQRFFTSGQRGLGDRHVYASRTRFIPDDLLPLFELAAWPATPCDDAVDGIAERTARIDVGARMRAMWR